MRAFRAAALRPAIGTALALLAVIAGAGCASEETTPLQPEDGITDLRVDIPAPDPAYIDFIGAETVIEPGTENLWCAHLRYDGPDTAFDLLETKQGEFGHHAALLGTQKPLEPGAGADCTHVDEMDQYEVISLGDQELPAGYATSLSSGKSLVIQSHYINASDKPIRIRDVVRLRKVPLADVVEWAAIYATAHLGFKLPPGQESTVQFECTVPQDIRLLLAGGHMHENGSAIEIQYGPDETGLQTMLKTDPWLAEYRDDPPLEHFFESPLLLPKGTLLRTRCDFKNTTAHEITYPEEMCISFGHVAGTKDPMVCAILN